MMTVAIIGVVIGSLLLLGILILLLMVIGYLYKLDVASQKTAGFLNVISIALSHVTHQANNINNSQNFSDKIM